MRPVDAVDGGVGAGLRLADGLAPRGDVEHAAAIGDDPSALRCRASVEDLNALDRRCFGTNSEAVIAGGGAFLRGLHQGGIGGCLKHFPGLGGAGQDTHLQGSVVDLPVGKNLQDHLAMWIMWARPHNTSPFRDLLRADRISAAFMQAYLLGTGPATIPPSGLAAFTRYNAELTAPEIQFLFRSAPGHPEMWFPGIRPAYDDAFGIRPVLLHPESRGEVLLRSANPRDRVRLVPRFFSAQSDIATLREGYRLGLDAVHQGPLDKYRGQRIDPAPETNSDADIEAWIRSKAITAHHPCATCPMGSGPEAVLDPELRVRGMQGLRVIDASAMPDLTSGNINAPVLMIAEKGADHVLGKKLPRAEAA